MANHLIHALNFGDDKFGFGLPVATVEAVRDNPDMGNIIIPNFVTSGNTDDKNYPCFIVKYGDLCKNNEIGHLYFPCVINGGDKKYRIHYVESNLSYDISSTVIVAVDDDYTAVETTGRLIILQAHSHVLNNTISNDSLDADVVASVSYTPGSFTANKPTKVASTTASYLTDVTPQTTTIKQVTQVSTGSVIGSLKTVSKTASKVTHTTANFVSSVGDTDVTASKVTTTAHTILTGVTETSATAVTNVSASTAAAIQSLTSTNVSVMNGITETSATVTKDVNITRGSAASLTASCESGCLNLSWTPNSPTMVSSTTTSVLTDVNTTTINVLSSVKAAATAAFVTGLSQSTASVVGSLTQSTAAIKSVLTNTTVTASKVNPTSTIAVNAVTATDVAFSAVDSVSTAQIVKSITTAEQSVLTGITETSATGVESITVVVGSAATYTEPIFQSKTTNLTHKHVVSGRI